MTFSKEDSKKYKVLICSKTKTTANTRFGASLCVLARPLIKENLLWACAGSFPKLVRPAPSRERWLKCHWAIKSYQISHFGNIFLSLAKPVFASYCQEDPARFLD